MAFRTASLILAIFATHAQASSDMGMNEIAGTVSLKAMESVFLRSEETHTKAISSMMSSMSSTKAWQILEKGNLTTPALLQATGKMQGQQANLRATPTGYSAVASARKLLNDMIYEAKMKYDQEQSKCVDYYSSQCAALEECRGKIAASNYEAAESRSFILDAQKTINKAEVDIPTQKLELKTHNSKCQFALERMRDRLKILEGDLAVLTSILKMTDCEDKKPTVQTSNLQLLHCQDTCTGASFISFNHDELKQKVEQLQSKLAHGLMQDTFKDLFDGIVGLNSMDFLQLNAEQTPFINKTKFNNPPTPRTEVPMDPCNDKAGGAPSATHKRAAKCTITRSPQCYKLQERFLLIQSGVQDEKENLLDEIDMKKSLCEETAKTLQTQIGDDQNRLSEAQTQLSNAMTKEANAGESARLTANENEQLNKDLVKQMKSCSKNYIQSETELCALKKIRGEMTKMKGNHVSGSVFFQDCEVSKWEPDECSAQCGGGEQKLNRNVLTQPLGGAVCVPLSAIKKCNMQPCPIDCKLSGWRDWSKCSAECGGGVQQRLREVTQSMKFGGKPCDATSETRACNNQACEKDCVLGGWTEWSICSKDCDGGTQKRQKFVKTPAVGAGKCDGRWSKARLEYKECNKHRCGLSVGAATLQCKEKLDVVLLLDGSGSLGKAGWKAEIKAAETFVDAFSGTGAQAEMAVVLYSGPRTWSGVKKCVREAKGKVDMENICKIKSVNHFTKNMGDVKTNIGKLKWPMGTTFTSLALLRAKEELSLGQPDAKSIVVAITDGRPLSWRATGLASRILRKSARLVWVAVTRRAPLRAIKRWATRRWQENLVQVKTFADLEKPDLVSHVIANICPSKR